MRVHTVGMDLEPGERITAKIHRPGLLCLNLGPYAFLWVEEAKTPEVYAEMCERFELKEESKTEAA